MHSKCSTLKDYSYVTISWNSISARAFYFVHEIVLRLHIHLQKERLGRVFVAKSKIAIMSNPKQSDLFCHRLSI
jgi:hypothetical protein